jgi:hypothetical protein
MITRRGKRVRAIAILLLASVALWAAWQVSTHLWYVGEGGNWLGYCWGTVEECFREGGL